MAEPIGLLVSAITLLNSTIGVFNFFSRFKDVPRAVRGFQIQAKQLEEILKVVQTNDALNSIQDPSLQNMLQNLTIDLQKLDEWLQLLARKLDGKKITKAWGFVRGVLEMREFEELMRNIEGHKSTLLLFLVNQTLSVALLKPKID